MRSGQQRAQVGSDKIKELGPDGYRVTYQLDITPLIPIPGFLVRRVMNRAASAAIDGLKREVESRAR